jgi:site-specific DNA-methyltransferase (adenine-specific)
VLDFDADFFAQFDTLLTDPPYSEHVHENAASVGVAGGEGMGAHARDLGFGSLTPELLDRIALAASCVRRWSLIFSDFESIHLWREACEAKHGAEYIRLLPWIRWSQPQLSGDRPSQGAEAISLFHRQRIGARGGRKPVAKHWNGPGNTMHLSRRCLRGSDKHPTEKPLDLELDCVSWFSDPGESVLSLCAGRGSTALACRLLGRDCVAIESDARWATPAGRRATEALSVRDAARAREWIVSTRAEASAVPKPKAADGSDIKTYERAQRRLADAERVARSLAA